MRIEAGVNSLYGSQRSQAAVDRSANSTSFSAVLSASQAGASQASSTKQVDFTSMSRQELRDWTNSQIRSGEMSLDDSRPFMAMSMKIPVSGGLGSCPPAVTTRNITSRRRFVTVFRARYRVATRRP